MPSSQAMPVTPPPPRTSAVLVMGRNLASSRIGRSPSLTSVPRALLAALLLVALLTSACGADPEPDERPRSTAESSISADPSASPEPTATPSSATSSTSKPKHRPRLVRGVDVSHHQGEIDWARVRRERIEFAYLKATEGTGFTDPRFQASARAARSAGLRVGGYHYFSLCSPSAPQAEHFARVLGSTPARSMPPAIDLELLGNCSDPPPRPELLAEVRAFIDIVERRTGQEVVVYAYPEFETRYRFAEALDRRQWVRRIGNRPPTRDWSIWQRDDQAVVDGIPGPADLNVMAPDDSQ